MKLVGHLCTAVHGTCLHATRDASGNAHRRRQFHKNFGQGLSVSNAKIQDHQKLNDEQSQVECRIRRCQGAHGGCITRQARGGHGRTGNDNQCQNDPDGQESPRLTCETALGARLDRSKKETQDEEKHNEGNDLEAQSQAACLRACWLGRIANVTLE